jgi:hypothetical protein
MPDKIRVCPHCNNQMRPWKEGDYLADFAEVDDKGKPIRQWMVCPGDPSAFVMTFWPERERPTKWIGRWRDKKGVWHNVLNWDLDPAVEERRFYAALFQTEEEARTAVHSWGNQHLDVVDLVAIENADQ